jgi:hypothetical protein
MRVTSGVVWSKSTGFGNPFPFIILEISLDPLNVYENIHAFPKESHLKHGFFALIMLFFRMNNKHDYLSSLHALS